MSQQDTHKTVMPPQVATLAAPSACDVATRRVGRRSFMHGVTAAGAAMACGGFAPRIAAAVEPDKRVRLAVVGLGRGMAHVQTLLKIPGVEVAFLAEVDPQRLALGMKSVAATGAATPQGVTDFRTALEDPTLDAVLIATPTFWHTPASLLALQAGKHVYVEKPGSHNPGEAEMIVAAAGKYGRLVQMGNQRRTWMKDAIACLHEGAIGRVRYGRAVYCSARKAVAPKDRPLPVEFDVDLWQGPVPDDPRHELRSLVHYDWHWFWHWGNGELGNNGVHFLDVLRWGLKADHPVRVTYTGGRYTYDDLQKTPDTATATDPLPKS
jgi:predicted dehydrogenase